MRLDYRAVFFGAVDEESANDEEVVEPAQIALAMPLYATAAENVG